MLVHVKPLSLKQALLGVTVELETLDNQSLNLFLPGVIPLDISMSLQSNLRSQPISSSILHKHNSYKVSTTKHLLQWTSCKNASCQSMYVGRIHVHLILGFY